MKKFIFTFVPSTIIRGNKDKEIALTEEKQHILDSQINADKSLYIDAKQAYTDFKKKYDL